MSTNKKLSESLKKKWASGTRKPNPEGYGKKISLALKRAHEEGRMHTLTREAALKGLKARDPEKVKENMRAIAKANTGKPMNGRGAKGPEHWHSKYWRVQNKALGVILEGRNLNDIVRRSPMFFDADDIVWNKHKCKATRGLRQLFEIKKSTGKPTALSWKGWTPVDKNE